MEAVQTYGLNKPVKLASPKAAGSGAPQKILSAQELKQIRRQNREDERHTKASAAAAATPKRTPSVVGRPNLSDSHLFVKPTTGKTRVIDELVTLGAGIVTPFWSMTRPTLGQQIAWAAGIGLLGGAVAIEAAGTEVGNFATGAAVANLSALAFRLIHPNLAKP